MRARARLQAGALILGIRSPLTPLQRPRGSTRGSDTSECPLGLLEAFPPGSQPVPRVRPGQASRVTLLKATERCRSHNAHTAQTEFLATRS